MLGTQRSVAPFRCHRRASTRLSADVKAGPREVGDLHRGWVAPVHLWVLLQEGLQVGLDRVELVRGAQLEGVPVAARVLRSAAQRSVRCCGPGPCNGQAGMAGGR